MSRRGGLFSSSAKQFEPSILQLERLSFGYTPNELIINECSYEFDSRCVYGIYGSSGQGKSSFARLLAGYHNALSGTIRLIAQGEDLLGTQTVYPVGLIAQNPELEFDPRISLHKSFSVFNTAPRQELLDACGLDTDWLTRKPSMLSGGQLQRCNIVRTLMLEPRFVIADEISTMLDALSQAKLLRALLEVRARTQFGLIVISHDRPVLELICDEVLDFSNLANMC